MTTAPATDYDAIFADYTDEVLDLAIASMTKIIAGPHCPTILEALVSATGERMSRDEMEADLTHRFR